MLQRKDNKSKDPRGESQGRHPRDRSCLRALHVINIMSLPFTKERYLDTLRSTVLDMKSLATNDFVGYAPLKGAYGMNTSLLQSMSRPMAPSNPLLVSASQRTPGSPRTASHDHRHPLSTPTQNASPAAPRPVNVSPPLLVSHSSRRGLLFQSAAATPIDATTSHRYSHLPSYLSKPAATPRADQRGPLSTPPQVRVSDLSPPPLTPQCFADAIPSPRVNDSKRGVARSQADRAPLRSAAAPAQPPLGSTTSRGDVAAWHARHTHTPSTPSAPPRPTAPPPAHASSIHPTRAGTSSALSAAPLARPLSAVSTVSVAPQMGSYRRTQRDALPTSDGPALGAFDPAPRAAWPAARATGSAAAGAPAHPTGPNTLGISGVFAQPRTRSARAPRGVVVTASATGASGAGPSSTAGPSGADWSAAPPDASRRVACGAPRDDPHASPHGGRWAATSASGDGAAYPTTDPRAYRSRAACDAPVRAAPPAPVARAATSRASTSGLAPAGAPAAPWARSSRPYRARRRWPHRVAATRCGALAEHGGIHERDACGVPRGAAADAAAAGVPAAAAGAGGGWGAGGVAAHAAEPQGGRLHAPDGMGGGPSGCDCIGCLAFDLGPPALREDARGGWAATAGVAADCDADADAAAAAATAVAAGVGMCVWLHAAAPRRSVQPVAGALDDAHARSTPAARGAVRAPPWCVASGAAPPLTALCKHATRPLPPSRSARLCAPPVVGSVAAKGTRDAMEDRCCSGPLRRYPRHADGRLAATVWAADQGVAAEDGGVVGYYAAVLDGHGGSFAVEAASTSLHAVLEHEVAMAVADKGGDVLCGDGTPDLVTALQSAFVGLDRAVAERGTYRRDGTAVPDAVHCGATMTVVMYVPPSDHAPRAPAHARMSTAAPPASLAATWGADALRRAVRGDDIHGEPAGPPGPLAGGAGLALGALTGPGRGRQGALLTGPAGPGCGHGGAAARGAARCGYVYVASVGDSHAVAGVGGRAVRLTVCHTARLPSEATRVAAAGVRVECGRVGGMLAVSRAIGDFEYKRKPRRAQLGRRAARGRTLVRRVGSSDSGSDAQPGGGYFGLGHDSDDDSADSGGRRLMGDCLAAVALADAARLAVTAVPTVVALPVCAAVGDPLAPAPRVPRAARPKDRLGAWDGDDDCVLDSGASTAWVSASADASVGAACVPPTLSAKGVDFVVIASDGLWDCVTPAQAVTYVTAALDDAFRRRTSRPRPLAAADTLQRRGRGGVGPYGHDTLAASHLLGGTLGGGAVHLMHSTVPTAALPLHRTGHFFADQLEGSLAALGHDDGVWPPVALVTEVARGLVHHALRRQRLQTSDNVTVSIMVLPSSRWNCGT